MSQKSFFASLDQLHEMLAFIEHYVKLHTNVERHIHQLILGSEEVLVNIIHYAYLPDQIKNVMIDCAFNAAEKKIVITFEDEGKPFNPLENVEKHRRNDPENDIGGQGISILKKLMDCIQYQRVGNNNVLMITKHLT